MLGRFLFGSAGVLALLFVTATPGPLQAQHGRGGGSRAMRSPVMRSPNFGGTMGGFDRRVFTPGFGRTTGGLDRRIFTPFSTNGFNSRFLNGRFDRDFDRDFDRRFNSGFGFTPGTMGFSPGFFGTRGFSGFTPGFGGFTPGFGGFTPGFFGSLGLGGFSPGLGVF